MTKRKSRTTASFYEHRRVMELAAQTPEGIRYRLPSWGKAVRFRQDCYTFRSKYRKELAEARGDHSLLPAVSPFETISIRIESIYGYTHQKVNERPPAEYLFEPDGTSIPYDCVFHHQNALVGGEILDINGNPIEEPPEEKSAGLGLSIDTEE